MGVLIAVPTAMIVTQPDLGTALLIAASGLIVMLLAGLQIRLILIALPLLGAAAWRLGQEAAWVLMGSGVFAGSWLIVAPRSAALLLGALPFTFGVLDGLVLWGDFSRLHLWRELSSSTLLFFNMGSLLAGLAIMALLTVARLLTGGDRESSDSVGH